MGIVAHQHDGTLEVVDGIDQRRAGVHIEMVGRLVEQQQVRGVARCQRQQQPRLLAARQHADLEIGAIARETEAAELGAHLGLAGGRPQGAAHVLKRRRLVVETFLLVLREVADAQARRALDLALAWLQAIRQQPDEGRLAVAILAEQGDAVVHVEPQVELAQHERSVGVADRDLVERLDRRGELLGGRKVEGNALVDRHRHDRAKLLDHLDPRLCLARLARLGLEAIDEGLHVLALGGDLGLLRGIVLEPLGARALEAVVVAVVGDELLLIDVDDVIAHVVQQVAIVAHHQERVAEAPQMLGEPQHRLEIEMVRRLVEDQQVGIAEQRAGQRHAHPPAAGEFAAGSSLGVVVETQAMQDRGGPRRRRGGADFVEPGMDVGQPHSVVAGLGFSQQRGALDVGGQHGVQHGDIATRRVLRHRADAVAAAQADAAAVGFDVALDQAQQGRFPGAIAADQADLPAVGHGRGGAIEQHALAVAEGEIIDVQHGAAAFSTRKEPVQPACRAETPRL